MRKKNLRPESKLTPRGGKASGRATAVPEPEIVAGRARGRGEAGE